MGMALRRISGWCSGERGGKEGIHSADQAQSDRERSGPESLLYVIGISKGLSWRKKLTLSFARLLPSAHHHHQE